MPGALVIGGGLRPILAFGLIGLAGCIDDPPGSSLPVMCEQQSDCDGAAGEVCDEGVCWGDPPDRARFAALLSPPADRSDLPSAVLPLLSIAADGTIAGLEFPAAVTVRGRVLLACPGEGKAPYACGQESSVGAQLLIERSAGFAGGPPLSRTVVASAGVGRDEDAFSFLLPRDPDAEYRITIQPNDDVAGEEVTPGEIAPPRQVILRADQDLQVEWMLGDPAELKIIAGCVQNVVDEGGPYAGMKVVAFGRWTELSPLERASSRSVTGPDGCFQVGVPRDMLDEFDISVQPAAGMALPSFTLRREFVRDPAEGERATVHVIVPPLVMPFAPEPTRFRLPVEAQSVAGGQEPVVGADVRFTTTFPPPSPNLDRDVEITFTAQATTTAGESDPGIAEVLLYPGDENNRRYLVSVTAPAGSPFQSAFQREVAVGIGGAEVLEALTLERRTALTATVRSNGELVADAPVEASPSALFRQNLTDEALEKAVAELPSVTATTDQSGVFLLWLDRELVGQRAAYDIDVAPSVRSGAPSWTFEEVTLDGDAEPVDLGTRQLPGASFARATVTDGSGRAVPGAELHVYQLPPDDYCAGVAAQGADCEPPSKLRGVWQSDEQGVIRVVLPDP